MSLFTKILYRIISNALAIFVAAKIIPGIHLEVSLVNLLIAGALFGFVNFFLKPILKIFSLPIIILTLGGFSIIINLAMFFLVSWSLDFLSIESFWSGLGGIIVISLVNWLIAIIAKD